MGVVSRERRYLELSRCVLCESWRWLPSATPLAQCLPPAITKRLALGMRFTRAPASLPLDPLLTVL